MAIAWIDTDDLEDADNPDAPYAIEYASFILYKLTAEKYPGVQEATEWYGTRGNGDWCAQMTQQLSEYGIGPVFLKGAGSLRSTINLRRRPVVEILSVENYTTGRELDPASYSLRNHAFLHKRNGTWNLTDQGIVVNYLYGMDPPEAGKRAAVRLASEIMKAITDPDNCALPERVTSVSRQGVNYTVLDPQEFINDGKTGLFEVDMFINAANPARAYKRPRVLIPGAPQGETIR